jgi:hypothetical protein
MNSNGNMQPKKTEDMTIKYTKAGRNINYRQMKSFTELYKA